jgi:CheY-like chemotaxis protein
MVRGFAEQSGGALAIESRAGQGTTVTILLPPTQAEAATDAGAPDGLPEAGRRDAVVLLVDDDAQGRPVTAALLRDLGYAVIEACDAERALAILHATPAIDLVVTDVIMPGIDGPALAGRIRAERPGLPVLFITGHPGTHALDDKDVLTKPFTARELRKIVERTLRG